MMDMPRGAVVLIALACLLGGVLTWNAQKTRATPRLDELWQVFEDYVAYVLMLTTLAAAVLQVVVRFLLAGEVIVSWTEELALLAMVWLAFWAGAAVSRQQDHICLDIVYDLLPASIQRWVRVFGDVLTIVVLVPIAWYGFIDARSQDVISTVSLGIPISVFAYVIPAIMSLIAVHSAVRLAENIRSSSSNQASRHAMKEAS